MNNVSTKAKARRLRSLHSGPVLVLPNAWDAGSAIIVADAGAQAIATTSGGVAWSRGFQDGEQLSRAQMIDAIRPIVDAVDVPVTVDVESGYGPTPQDVADTVTAVLDAGAVGINLEDSGAPTGGLFSPELQADRIRAARRAAESAGVDELVINLRTDVFLFGIGAPEARLDDVAHRAHIYAAAGADCLFVPGLLDLHTFETLAKTSPIPVSAMAMTGGPSVAEFAAAGVQRVSIGTAIAQAAYTDVRRAARELLDHGTYGTLGAADAFGEINGLFRRS